jgi:transposase
MRRAYQSDLSDAEWGCLEPHLPAPETEGRPRLHSPREILDAVFYVLKSGCAWRLLPHDLGLPGRPSTTNSELGGWAGSGRGCTPPCASGLGRL